MKTFFTSDSHFGHKNIIKHCNRPFASVEVMDEDLMARWNAVVSPEDTVYHLGDFSLLSANKVSALLSRLHGTKHLIVGNHDTVQGVAQINLEGYKIVLCHYPMREWPGMWRGALHLYGHVHGNMQPLPGSMDMCADVWGGNPVTLGQILKAMGPYSTDDLPEQYPFQVSLW